MAIQILDELSLGQTLGSALGSGLGNALQLLAQNKLQEQMQQKQVGQRANALQALRMLNPQQFGQLSNEQLNQFAQLPGQSFDIALKQLLQQPLIQAGGAPQQQFEALESIITGRQPAAPAQPGMQPQMMAEEEEIVEKPVISAPEKREQPEEERAARPVERPKVQKFLAPGAQAERELERLEKRLQDPRLTPEQKMRLRSQIEKRQESFEKKQGKIDAATKDFVKNTKDLYKASKDGKLRLDRMEELINKGDLPTPFLVSLLDLAKDVIPIPGTGKSIGINLKGAVLSDDAQEFDKLSTDFVKDAKKFFGSRLTDTDLKTFLRTVPTLSQSKEGKKRVINNMRKFNKINELKYQALQEILEENRGYTPRNVEDLVEKRIKKDVDKIAKDFKAGIKEDAKLSKALLIGSPSATSLNDIVMGNQSLVI